MSCRIRLEWWTVGGEHCQKPSGFLHQIFYLKIKLKYKIHNYLKYLSHIYNWICVDECTKIKFLSPL